jgi:3-phenylpropionate/trans-cinnamate dioxygenase ferredoxin reductase component
LASNGVVVVGGGPAAASLAKALRDRGFDGPISLVTDEPYKPYERPPLSKGYLKGERQAASLGVLPEEWYGLNDVHVRTRESVGELDTRSRELVTSAGRRVRFDWCVIATGGRPRLLSVPDLPAKSTRYLRSLADADQLRNDLKPGSRLAIVGGGFIGGELAATARRLGVDVTIIEALELPLLRVLGPQLAELYRAIHLENQVQLITEATVVRTVGTGRDGLKLVLSTGRCVECDVVAIGVGMIPNRELADGSGIKYRAGILVNEFGQTNVPGILAAGDVTEHYHPLFRQWMRTEHHEHALRQPVTLAETILGRRTPYVDPRWFWSEQYEYRLEVSGAPSLADTEVLRGDVGSRKFTKFFICQGRLIGAIGLNSGHDVRRAGRLIAAQGVVDAAALRNPDVDLRTLVLTAESSKVG